LFLLLIVPILITCTQFSLSGDSDILVKRLKQEPVPASSGKAIGVILEENTNTDLELSLYRNPPTKDIVVSFYNSITQSDEITLAVLDACLKYEVKPALAFAVCGIESRFDRTAIGYNVISVDRGLFQLNSLAFPDLGEEEFFSVRENADRGLKYLRYCLDRGENEIVALAMYNAGETQVSFSGTPMTTLHYISRILQYRDELENRFREAVLEKFTS
jgi:hypothetical protein